MADTIKNTGPLAGLKVLDLTRVLAGPTCTQLLGDFGADIIKVERPDKGDDTRAWGPPYVTDEDGNASNESAYYLSANRNKRSVAIDIATTEGADIVRKLARHCDILVENFKTGGLKDYGLDYDSIAAINPALIYCSITGYGQTGPNAHLPGYDLLAQGYGGIMSLTGEPSGEPMKVGVAISDIVCGLYASNAVLAALRHRDQNGGGQHIDIALVDTQISWLANQGTNYLMSGENPKRQGNQHPNIVPYQVFKASDGHLIVAVGNDGQFARLCELLDLPHLANDPKFATNNARVTNRVELIKMLSQSIAKYTKSKIIEKMGNANVPGGVINTLSEVFASDQVKTREMKISVPYEGAQSGKVDLLGNPVKFSKTPVSYRHAPPKCGQHNDEVLGEIADE